MAYENLDAMSLLWQAQQLRALGRFADAITFYERFVNATDQRVGDRSDALFWLSTCLRNTGRIEEALALSAELYAETEACADKVDLAFRAYYTQLHFLRLDHHVEHPDLERCASERLSLVELGLQWLRDVGKWHWRPALLREQAYAHWDRGERESALAVAEEAYRTKKEFSSPGYALGCYARKVVEYARELGHLVRALQVLEEAERRESLPKVLCELQVERVLTLLAEMPPRTGEALAIARRLVRDVESIQDDSTRIDAFASLAKAATASHSLAEATEAYSAMSRVALGNTASSRAKHLRDTLSHLGAGVQDLVEEDSLATHELRVQLQTWKEMTERELGSESLR